MVTLRLDEGRLPMKNYCSCGCCDPVATTPEEMLRFLANRFEHAGVADEVARVYARDIRLILKTHYGVEE